MSTSTSMSMSMAKEPVFSFHVPAMPNITHIPEPQPPKRVPIAGYDVKTLRKQNEFLLSEIQEREERHLALYQQNRELWRYTEELIEASRVNAHQMKTHVTKLHEELRHSHEIRSALAAKLVTARDSKALIKHIYKQIGQAQFDSSEADRLCLEAERALLLAREDNEVQEASLQNKLQHLQLLQWQIDENADREKVDSLMAVAEEYWSTNQTTLRVAYHRFKSGVGRQIRKANMFAVMRAIYDKHLKSKHFRLMRFYLDKRRFMHAKTSRRTRACAQRCLFKWKLYTSTEKYCKRARRRALLRKTFQAWTASAQEGHFDQWAAVTTLGFTQRQTLQRVFRGWKRSCVFLQWGSRSPLVLTQERLARRHLLARIVGRWRSEACRQRARMGDLALALCTSQKSRVFHSWKQACKAMWQRRGLLLLRFVRNCKALVSKRAARSQIAQRARDAHASWSLFSALAKLRERGCRALYVRRKVSHFISLGVFRHRRVLKASLSCMQVVAATTRRRKFCFEASIVFERHRKAREGFRAWRAHVRADKQSRRRSSHKRFRAALGHWGDFVWRNRARRRASAVAQVVCLQKSRHVLRSVLHTLRARAKGRRHRAYALRRLAFVLRGKCVSQCFLAWRGRWSSAVFSRLKDSRSEADRNRSLLSLKVAELADLDRSRAELATLAQEQEAKMLLLQGSLDEKERLIRESLELLETRRVDKKELEFSLFELQRQLEVSQQERRHLSEVEGLLMREREKDLALVTAQTHEAEVLVRSLQGERGALLGTAKASRERVQLAARLAVDSVRAEEATLHESEATARAMEALEKAKDDSVRSLSLAHVGLQQNLESMQSKLNIVLKQGFCEVNSAESELRQRTSQVRVATSNAGMLEARNAELQRILQEEEAQLARMQGEETVRAEDAEIRGLGLGLGLGVGSSLEDSYLAAHQKVQKLVKRLGV